VLSVVVGMVCVGRLHALSPLCTPACSARGTQYSKAKQQQQPQCEKGEAPAHDISARTQQQRAVCFARTATPCTLRVCVLTTSKEMRHSHALDVLSDAADRDYALLIAHLAKPAPHHQQPQVPLAHSSTPAPMSLVTLSLKSVHSLFVPSIYSLLQLVPGQQQKTANAPARCAP
jgi:hypothetical protein